MSLPPLPEPNVEVISGHREPFVSYDADQMREYGQACRAAALEEALTACMELTEAYETLSGNPLLTSNGKTVHQGMYGGAHNCAAAIRNLK